MSSAIKFWGVVIILFLAAVTALIFFLLRSVIKYYRAPDEILPKKWELAAANALIPPVPAIILINNFVSHLPAFKDHFEADSNLYPLAIFATLVILIVFLALIFELFLTFTHPEYRKFRIGPKKDA